MFIQVLYTDTSYILLNQLSNEATRFLIPFTGPWASWSRQRRSRICSSATCFDTDSLIALRNTESSCQCYKNWRMFQKWLDVFKSLMCLLENNCCSHQQRAPAGFRSWRLFAPHDFEMIIHRVHGHIEPESFSPVADGIAGKSG